MEFPNPEDKRAHSIRLFAGYALIAIFVGLTSLILVYLAQGYGYDPNKGLQRSGLVFFSSKPVSTNVYIDDKLKDKTDVRLTLNEGPHKISLKQEKYRDWDKTVSIDGGSVSYLVYPRLFPVDIRLGINQTYTATPQWQSQSPDMKRLILQSQKGVATFTDIDLQKPTADPININLSDTVLIKNAEGYGVFAPIEWSDDNRHLLIKQTLSDNRTAFIIIDREDATLSQNVSAKLALSAGVELSLRDKKYDKYYSFTPANGALNIADLKTGVQASPILTGVVSFKTYADNIVLYVTYSGAKDTEAKVKILNNKTDTYNLQSLTRNNNNNYILDVSNYSGKYFYVTSSQSENSVLLYRDPLDNLKVNNTVPAKPRLSLNLVNPEFASFSNNSRFISLQSGRRFVVFDAELNRIYRYQSVLSVAPSGQKAKWMDDYRMSIVTDGKVNVFEFDGANIQTLVASKAETTPYFDKDYKYIYTFINQADTRIGFQNGLLVVD